MNWLDLREDQFDDAIQKADGLCIIPVGCFEMHGQHMPVGSDTYEAIAVAEKAAEMEPAVVFPAFKFGDVTGLVNFYGSVNLEPELRVDLLENYCDEIARCGFDKILLLNYHGGNNPMNGYFTNMMAQKNKDYSVMVCFPAPDVAGEIWPLVKEGGLDFAPELLPEDIETMRIFAEEEHQDGHAGFMETSLLLATNPETMKMERCNVYDGRSTHRGDMLEKAGLRNVATYGMNFPNNFTAYNPWYSNERFGRLFLRYSAELAVKAMRAYKENNHLLVKLREKRRAICGK